MPMIEKSEVWQLLFVSWHYNQPPLLRPITDYVPKSTVRVGGVHRAKSCDKLMPS